MYINEDCDRKKSILSQLILYARVIVDGSLFEKKLSVNINKSNDGYKNLPVGSKFMTYQTIGFDLQ